MSYWIGVPKEKGQPNRVIESSQPTPEEFPWADYLVGPFETRETAETHVIQDPAVLGFVDPFCNNGGGR